MAQSGGRYPQQEMAGDLAPGRREQVEELLKLSERVLRRRRVLKG